MKYAVSYLLIFTLLLGMGACGDNNKPSGNNFDRRGMLTHFAEQIIVPAYTDAREQATLMEQEWQLFEADPTELRLWNVQQRWFTAYSAFLKVSAFNFGPAAESGLNKSLAEELATFPVSSTKIENYISANDTTFNNFDRDTRGFMALDYLWFKADAATLTAELRDNPNRRLYVSAVLRHLRESLQTVLNRYTLYRQEFPNNNGTDAGSSTSALYNEFVKSFEVAKNFKVGLPAGKRPGQTQAEPQKVEGYYSARSLELLRIHLFVLQDIYYGRAPGNDGVGFKEYLDAVAGGPDLVSATEGQWAQVKIALNALPTDRPLSQLIAENDSRVDALHTELQKMTRFWKSDMSSLLGIAITYSSGDGD
ncbi:MAG: imelysin family protein [Chitinophagales bacterium]|nr:imelysin family protein [Chitinophagales bacterium]